jgi:ABC-type branched-subunit amino acid transport system substrate-binding protein
VSKRHVALGITLVAAAVFLAACGGGSSSSSSSSSTGSNTGSSEGSNSSEAGAEPVKLMAMGPIEAPGFSLPGIPIGAEIAIEEINAKGGVNGHLLELVTCNDLNEPNAAIDCARQAIKEEVVALVGGLSGSDLKVIPLLAQAGIPWVGPSTADAYTEENLFLIGNEGAPGYVAIGSALSQIGCKDVGVVIATLGLPQSGEDIEAGLTANGTAKVVGTFKAPTNSVDWAPIVTAAHSAGADCIGGGVGPSELPGLIAAMESGPKMKLVVLSGGLPDALASQIGAQANGVYTVSGYLPFTSESGVVQELGAKAKAKNPKVPPETFTQTGYASVGVVAEAAKGLEEITAATLMEALPTVSNYDTGLGPVLNLTKSIGVPGFERTFNPDWYLNVVKNDVSVLAQPKPIDVTAGLTALSEG